MRAPEPILTTPIAGVSVRLYKAPDGRVDVPWHSFADICAAAKLPRGTRDELLGKARSHADVGLATLPDGVTIQSHAMAAALIGAMTEIGAVPPSFADDYRNAGAAALEAMHADLTAADSFESLRAIARETLGVELVLPQ